MRLVLRVLPLVWVGVLPLVWVGLSGQVALVSSPAPACRGGSCASIPPCTLARNPVLALALILKTILGRRRVFVIARALALVWWAWEVLIVVAVLMLAMVSVVIPWVVVAMEVVVVMVVVVVAVPVVPVV